MWKSSCASMALAAMMFNTIAVAAEPALTLATSTGTIGEQFANLPNNETKLTETQKLALVRQNIKYVFVIFQENRSFDSYFGTYPGANGLVSTFPGADPSDPYAQPANQTASYVQNIRNTDGSYSPISPFLSPRTIKDLNGNTVQLYPESLYSVDHSHTGYIADFHLQDTNKSVTLNDGYALDQEGLEYASASSSTATGNVVTSSSQWPPNTQPPTSNPSLIQKQKGEVVLSHPRLRYHPLPVALCRYRHAVRQFASDDRRPVDAECDRHHRGAERRHAMGASSEHDRRERRRRGALRCAQ